MGNWEKISRKIFTDISHPFRHIQLDPRSEYANDIHTSTCLGWIHNKSEPVSCNHDPCMWTGCTYVEHRWQTSYDSNVKWTVDILLFHGWQWCSSSACWFLAAVDWQHGKGSELNPKPITAEVQKCLFLCTVPDKMFLPKEHIDLWSYKKILKHPHCQPLRGM